MQETRSPLVGYGQRVARTKKLYAALTRRGPHRVLRGDLAFAGLPGIVYTPAAGRNLPAVAFAHDWITPTRRYHGTLEHLASWGIVAAAPNTETGLAPSVLNLAYELGITLDIAAGVRLGTGDISVHPAKLGLAGHGFGASAAVFAAAGMAVKPKAVFAAYPTITRPSAEQPAATLKVPGLTLTAPTLKAQSAGLAEGRRLSQAVGLPGPDRRSQKPVRALLTGYLLFMLAGDKVYKDFADPEADLPKAPALDPFAEDPVELQDKVAALLKT